MRGFGSARTARNPTRPRGAAVLSTRTTHVLTSMYTCNTFRLVLKHETASVVAAGLGVGVSFHIEDAGGTAEQACIDVSAIVV